MYTVVRPVKSVGIAILLTLLFGPIGLFYASVVGGFVMTFGPLALFIYLLIAQDGLALFTFISGLFVYILLGWLVCIVWAIISVKAYNAKLIAGSVISTVVDNVVNVTSPTLQQLDANPESYDERLTFTSDKVRIMYFVVGILVLITSYLIYDKLSNDKSNHKSEFILKSGTEIYFSPNIKSEVLSYTNKEHEIIINSNTKYFTNISLIDDNGKTIEGYVLKSKISNNSDNNSTEILNKQLAPISEASTLPVERSPYDNNIAPNSLVQDVSPDEELHDVEEQFWQVTSDKAYFYKRPNASSVTKAYLVKGETIRCVVNSSNFVYIEYINNKGKITIGFISKEDINAIEAP